MRKLFSLLLLAATAAGCKGSDGIDPISEKKSADIYPVPPARWQQAAAPYFSGGYVGDPMPHYFEGKFQIFFLHDARDGASGLHPIDRFSTTDLTRYTYEGRQIFYGRQNQQDWAVGTGSVVKVGDLYYCFYTGHNGQFPAQGKPTEGVMYATSPDMKTWAKDSSYILYAPAGYTANDFRDPHVIYNDQAGRYEMYVSTRKDGHPVVARFTSANPASKDWQVQPPLYQAETDAYFMLECADVFKMGSYYYLLFSEDYVAHTTHYRMAASLEGPWLKPENDLLNGRYFYAGKSASDGQNRYIWGWNPTKDGQSDAGGRNWGGNLVAHKLVQNADGTLSTALPEAVAGLFGQNGGLGAPVSMSAGVSAEGGTFSLTATDTDTARVIFGPITGSKLISATVVPGNGKGGFGLVLNAGDVNHRYYIAFNPDVQRVTAVYNNGVAPLVDASISYPMTAGTPIRLQLVLDRSVGTLYLDGKAALNFRAYAAPNHSWGFFAGAGSQAVFQSLSYKENAQ